MKKHVISDIKSKFYQELFFAKQNGFEGVLLSLDTDADPYYLDTIEPQDELYLIAEDFGWEQFILIDFVNNKDQILDLYDAA